MEYVDFVKSLFKSGAAIREDMPKVPDAALTRFHACVGICGEVGELFDAVSKHGVEKDLDNLLEELGDLLFYVTALDTTLFEHIIVVNPEKPFRVRPRYEVQRMSIAASNMLDISKKEVLYCKPFTEELGKAYAASMLELLNAMALVLHHYAWTFDEVRAANVTKLEKRYPQGTYSNKDAQQRADKAITLPSSVMDPGAARQMLEGHTADAPQWPFPEESGAAPIFHVDVAAFHARPVTALASGDLVVGEIHLCGKCFHPAMEFPCKYCGGNTPVPEASLCADVMSMLGMLKEREWAEHSADSQVGKMLEAAITELHSELNTARDLLRRAVAGLQTVREPGREFIVGNYEFINGDAFIAEVNKFNGDN